MGIIIDIIERFKWILTPYKKKTKIMLDTCYSNKQRWHEFGYVFDFTNMTIKSEVEDGNVD